MKTNQRKINIYLLNKGQKLWVYECSTNWSKTCKDAKENFLKRHEYLAREQVKASFSK